MKDFNIVMGNKSPIKMWTVGLEDEPEAKSMSQISNIANMPFIHNHVAVMPDYHYGKGATIGTVIATKGAVIPAAVGVDLGCGMEAIKTNIVASDLPDNLGLLRSMLEAAIPHGRTNDGKRGDRGAWGTTPDEYMQVWLNELEPRYAKIVEKYPKINKPRGYEPVNTHQHLGT